MPNENAGKCYEVARNWVSENPDWILIHGTVESNGERIGHAWCELGDDVVDLTKFADGKMIHKDTFMKIHKAEILKKFDSFQAFAENVDRGHYGPWTD